MGTTSGKSPAHEFYEQKHCSQKTLMVLCQGLLASNGSHLFDETTAPWKLMKVQSYCPNANDFKGETERRWKIIANTTGENTVVSPPPKQCPEICDSTVWGTIVELWSDPEFISITKELNTLHSDFPIERKSHTIMLRI